VHDAAVEPGHERLLGQQLTMGIEPYGHDRF
jgi:hypothetical protein